MQILGFIIIVVGIALLITGRNVGRYMPPNYQDNEDGDFLQLLKGIGKTLTLGGILFLVAGILCIAGGSI